MSVSVIRRVVSSPKKVLGTAAVAAATVGMALTAAPAHAATATPASATQAQAIAHKMIPDAAQFNAFSHIVQHESGWDVDATNASSGAYGLVQALPGSKMASAGFRLEDQRRHPDQVGPRLHELPLRQPRGRLELLAGQRLVLSRTSLTSQPNGGDPTRGRRLRRSRPAHVVHWGSERRHP